MQSIPREQVLKRIEGENNWWAVPHRINEPYYAMKRRAYIDLLIPLVTEMSVKRAVLLMGPRRVGKTVLIHHIIQHLIDNGVDPMNICYLSIDHPIYNGLGLHELMDLYLEASGSSLSKEPVYLFFDEIQYLKGWEIHLKSLVDRYPEIKFVASGSAAAALKLKSTESGAGRFTDFLLPPLTFYEYLDLLDKGDMIFESNDIKDSHDTHDIDQLNDVFVHYLNYGGYPEAIFSNLIQSNLSRFIKSDIIDKVLLRDLPSLYGIHDIQELNSLFTTLAYNTADEVSLEKLSQSSGVAKNTIKRYIEYLEAAFLIKTVHRIDKNAKRFQRANFFKVYLTNPSIRSALFTPVTPDEESMGNIAETGIYSQWFHSDTILFYARWKHGEVDMVHLKPNLMPVWAVEVKWTDRYVDRPHELSNLLAFCDRNRCRNALVTTRTRYALKSIGGIQIEFIPASLYCYEVGYNLIKRRRTILSL
ncbi:MAG TPA: ATP-binding protein [Syntrophobacteraceae bacterium]|nr:ATP-binding protein [Syntrophobacteraceae bacterium]